MTHVPTSSLPLHWSMSNSLTAYHHLTPHWFPQNAKPASCRPPSTPIPRPKIWLAILSIGQLCDAGCTALFDRTTVTIYSANTILATGQRAPNGLWTIKVAPGAMPTPNPVWPHATPTLPRANLSTLANQTASNQIAFLHAAAGYPVPSTRLCAIHKGSFTTWPALTTTAVKRHLQNANPS
jgi:hypothetical protein